MAISVVLFGKGVSNKFFDAQVLEKRWSGERDSDKEFELLVSFVEDEQVKIARVFVPAVVYASADKFKTIPVHRGTRPPIIITDEDVRKYG